MLPAVIAYPQIDPVAISLGPLPIRWYAIAYIAGLLLGWAYARRLAGDDRLWGDVARPSVISLDDLLVYAALGVVVGGRLGYVLFYNPSFYLANPEEIIAVWRGGMAFHGGLAGAALGVWWFARRAQVSALVVADICSAVVTIRCSWMDRTPGILRVSVGSGSPLNSAWPLAVRSQSLRPPVPFSSC